MDGALRCGGAEAGSSCRDTIWNDCRRVRGLREMLVGEHLLISCRRICIVLKLEVRAEHQVVSRYQSKQVRKKKSNPSQHPTRKAETA